MNIEHVANGITYRIQTQFTIGADRPASTASAHRKNDGEAALDASGNRLEVLGNTPEDAIAKMKDRLNK